MGDGHDQNTIFNHPVNDPEREPPHRALPMKVIQRCKPPRIGSQGTQCGVDGIREADRHLRTSFRVPVKGLVKITTRGGKIING